MTPGEADPDREEARRLAVLGAPRAPSPSPFLRHQSRSAALVVRGVDAERQLDPPDPLEDPLRHHPLAGEDVADHAEGEELDRGDEEHRAEDQRLDVAAGVAVEDPVEQERHPGGEREQRDEQAGAGEDLAAARSGCRCGGSRARCGARSRRSSRRAATRASAGWSRRDLVDGDQHLAGLDQALQRVGEVVDDEQAERRLAVVGAEAGGGVGDLGPREPPHDPAAQPLQGFLGAGEVVDAG